MSSNTTKTKSNVQLGSVDKPQAAKRNLVLNFIKFMVWVIVIGLLLSPLAGKQTRILDNLLYPKPLKQMESVEDD